ncbi:MAG: hypothetical protein U5L07_00885 [Desulfobacterales bacterium]|nr:hypothetical protein [Desulfobacterales bacterium]
MTIDINSLKPFIAKIDAWIDGYINAHREKRIRVADLGFPNLPAYFAPHILKSAYAVYTDQVKAPPLHEMGLEGFSFFESMDPEGITYKDTFFITPDHQKRESIHFHELIHIIQWNELGVENFILTYGANLLVSGYRLHPLEAIAYDLQADFDRGHAIANLESRVRSHCRNLAENPLVKGHI